MRESVRKLGLIGAGLWAMTEEKIDDLVKDLVDKGDISKEEGKKAIQDLLEESKNRKQILKRKFLKRFRMLFPKKIFSPKKMCTNLKQG